MVLVRGESYEFPHGEKAGGNPQAAQQASGNEVIQHIITLDDIIFLD